uniref:CUE domain-containing protein n=2 Tax=Rhodosorus marinus TaxID=101924 RepID=A0A7S2ZQD1_9RHOD
MGGEALGKASFSVSSTGHRWVHVGNSFRLFKMACFVNGAGLRLPTESRRVCASRNKVASVRMQESGRKEIVSNTTSVWEETVTSLQNAFPEYSEEEVDTVLMACGGEETLALEKLASMSQMNRLRGEELKAYEGRVSLLEEGRLRREATGSAKDFFKSHVEVEGSYVDQGYVDDQADTMGSIKKAFGGIFGFGKSDKEEKGEAKAQSKEIVGRDE